jgi:hypothetical protein
MYEQKIGIVFSLKQADGEKRMSMVVCPVGDR